jgi:hypothetical protein
MVLRDSISVTKYKSQALSAKPTPESEGPMQIHNSKNILIISVSYNLWGPNFTDPKKTGTANRTSHSPMT